MEEVVRYTYRLRPGRTAETALLSEWGKCRWLWNEAVHQYKRRLKPTICKLSKLLTEARGENAWLRDGSQVAQQQMLRTYMTALDNSFKVKGRGRPKLKKAKTELPSLEYTTRGFRIKDGRLRLPNGVSIPVVWSRELPSDPTSVRVYRDSLGHWYASFVVRRDTVAAPDVDGAVGVDWGVKTTAATTDAQFDLPHARPPQAVRRRAGQGAAKMARRRRPQGPAPSKGYLTAKRQAARIEKRAARQNTHDARAMGQAGRRRPSRRSRSRTSSRSSWPSPAWPAKRPTRRSARANGN